MHLTRTNETTGGINRRDFIKTALTTSALMASGFPLLAQETKGDIPYRLLGRTGIKISTLGLGGFHIGLPKDEQEGIRLIRTAIDRGITFMDNCWDYHDGRSEIRMGKALKDGYRDKVFLMTKFDGRTRQSATQQIDESLRRLQVDHVDLMQVHEIIRIEDPDRIFAPGGAMEAVMAAKQAGKIRFIGFTGHKDPMVHLRTLEIADKHQFRFDAVQMPLNVMDAHFRSFEHQVLPRLVKQEIGVLGMKPLASGAILKTQAAAAQECLHYAMSLPTSTVITGIESMKILDQASDAGRTFKPMTQEQIATLLARTAAPAATGNFEQFKTGTRFDATARNPHWLG